MMKTFFQFLAKLFGGKKEAVKAPVAKAKAVKKPTPVAEAKPVEVTPVVEVASVKTEVTESTQEQPKAE
jgi:hypothetical protein